MEASNANVATFLAGGFVRDLSNIILAVPPCIVLSDLSQKLKLLLIQCFPGGSGAFKKRHLLHWFSIKVRRPSLSGRACSNLIPDGYKYWMPREYIYIYIYIYIDIHMCVYIYIYTYIRPGDAQGTPRERGGRPRDAQGTPRGRPGDALGTLKRIILSRNLPLGVP